MKICLIGSKNRTETEKSLLYESVDMKHVPISDISLFINNGVSFVYNHSNINEFDAVIFRVPKKKYNLAASITESLPKDVIILSSPKSFYSTSSRLTLYETLSRFGVSVPKVIFADNPDVATSNLKLLKFPILIKVPTDSNKIMLANSQQEAKSMIDALQVLEQPMIFEEYHPQENIIHLYMIGNDAVVALKRKSTEVNYSGGILSKQKPGRKIINVALKVMDILKTDYARIDILDAIEPVVIDVELCPFLKEATNVSGVNIPHKLVEYLKKIKKK